MYAIFDSSKIYSVGCDKFLVINCGVDIKCILVWNWLYVIERRGEA